MIDVVRDAAHTGTCSNAIVFKLRPGSESNHFYHILGDNSVVGLHQECEWDIDSSNKMR